jgi:hypothetical protein
LAAAADGHNTHDKHGEKAVSGREPCSLHPPPPNAPTIFEFALLPLVLPPLHIAVQNNDWTRPQTRIVDDETRCMRAHCSCDPVLSVGDVAMILTHLAVLAHVHAKTAC